MSKEDYIRVHKSIVKLNKTISSLGRIPEEGTPSETHKVLPASLTRDTRGYIDKVANQINGTFQRGWFDACAVMMRRLLETLIIEMYEAKGIANKITDQKTGDYFFLSDLINQTLSEKSWSLTRNTKRALPKFKDLGDKSAHSRRYNAKLIYIDEIRQDYRLVIEELLYLSELRK